MKPTGWDVALLIIMAVGVLAAIGGEAEGQLWHPMVYGAAQLAALCFYAMWLIEKGINDDRRRR